MTWLCPRPCRNKTADGYCGTSWCINPMYSNIGTANEKLMGGLRKTTNADRLRSMTDKELAEWLAEVLFHCSNTICDERCPMYKCCCDQPSDNIEDWLKQEAKDNG